MILLDTKDSIIEDGINTVVTIGNFDGVHIGHQKLISECLEISKHKNLSSVVLSFYPHPKKVLNSDFVFKAICTQPEKVDLLISMGVDYFRRKPIDLEFLGYTPKEFVEKVLVNELSAKVVVVGEDFHFGSNRGANAQMLSDICEEYSIETVCMDLTMENGEKISSTTIRKYIQEHNIEQANNLLGRRYSIAGKVVGGKRLGRTIGVPTANIFPEEEKILPPNGVYLSEVLLKGQLHHAITNIGNNPTVNAERLVVETYIFDFDDDIYGEFITVRLLSYIRGEQKFDSIQMLKEELHRNISTGKEMFENNNF